MSDWAKSKFANLRRYIPSGAYHCHATVCGQLVRKSLHTKSETIAKLKLDALLEKERKRLGKKPNGETIMSGLFETFTRRLQENPDVKESTRLYRAETVKAIRALWGGIDDLVPQRVTREQVETFAVKLRAAYSPTRFNGILETLRAVFQIAIEQGECADNPVVFANRRRGVKGIPRAKIIRKQWKLPSRDKFADLKKRLAAIPSRQRSSLTVQFLMCSGMRIGAARRVMPEHVDLKANTLAKPPIKYTDEITLLPMFPALKAVVKELLALYPGEGPLLPVKNPRRALRNSCIEAGIEPLTNHALRHIFVIRCIEAQVPVPVIAEWLDHRDKGRTLLANYAHLIDEVSHHFSRRVKF